MDDSKEENKRRTAVALKSYDEKTGEFKLPKITASGYGVIAEQIIAMARDSGVEIREDGDLAELLAQIGTESSIPSEALVAVAEILAYVYRANGKL